mmetsp:Transcript_97372/g.314035  ORF Transcript_97372/g.314035 Transcript_97372/m.314035 type:complete len:253 (+) Transcript_97372:1630-2388(+)
MTILVPVDLAELAHAFDLHALGLADFRVHGVSEDHAAVPAVDLVGFARHLHQLPGLQASRTTEAECRIGNLRGRLDNALAKLRESGPMPLLPTHGIGGWQLHHAVPHTVEAVCIRRDAERVGRRMHTKAGVLVVDELVPCISSEDDKIVLRKLDLGLLAVRSARSEGAGWRGRLEDGRVVEQGCRGEGDEQPLIHVKVDGLSATATVALRGHAVGAEVLEPVAMLHDVLQGVVRADAVALRKLDGFACREHL